MGAKDWRFLCLLWLLAGTALTLVLVAIGGRDGLPLYYTLTHDGIAVDARVVRIDRGNHCLAEYRFRADGVEYGGAGNDCQAEVGLARQVTYLRGDPTRSVLGQGRDVFLNEVISVLFAAVLMPPLAFFLWRLNNRKG